MKYQWSQITDWLRINAPASAELLRPAEQGSPVPGRAGMIRPWFADQGGANRDMRASVLFGYVPLSGAEAFDAQQLIEELVPEWLADWDLVSDENQHPFIPIGDSGAGPLLVVDTRNGFESRTVKELDWEDPTTLEQPLWSRLERLLEAVLETLQGRRAGPFGIRPVVSDGYLSWTAPIPEPTDVVVGDAGAASTGWSWARLVERVAENRSLQPANDSRRMALIAEALDRLVGLTPEELFAATVEVPEEIGTQDLNVLLAACVDYAFSVRGLTPPAWARGRWNYMKPAWVIPHFPSAEIERLGHTPDTFVDHGIAFDS